MRFIPYAVGGFMLLPFVLWAGLFAVFPGTKPGFFDSPTAFALVAVSIPLVLFHYIAGLGYVANSIAGRPGEALPVWAPARAVQRAMAPLTVVLSVAAFAWVSHAGEGLAAAFAVAAAGLAMALIMAGARRARGFDALLVHPARAARDAAGLVGRAILAIPVLGHMLREVGRDPHRAGPLFFLNVALFFGVLVALFGFSVLVIPAMLAVPAVFYALLSLGAD
ncbi:MAG: hypothetical protein ACOC0V_00850 [Oceanicaulis sp.]